MSVAAAAPPPAPVEVAPSSTRGRSFAAVLCLVLAGILTIPAGIAYWGQRTLNDADRYIATVGPLVNNPDIQEAIATKVTDAIEQQVDVEALLNEAFAGVITDRPRLQALVGPIAGAVNGLIEREVQDFVASDAFQSLWITANQRAQEVLIQVLNGETPDSALQVQGDEIVLDVSEVIDRVKQRLVDRGLTVLDRVQLPDRDRQIVLVEAPQLKQMKNIYAFSNPVAKWLIVVVALLYLAAFVLARRRPRITAWIGAVLALNGLLLAWALETGQSLFSNQLQGTVFGPASSAFYDQLLTYLERGQDVLLWLGLILIVVGWFAGSNSTGAAARTAISGGLESLGAALPAGPPSDAGRWVTANATWLRIVSVLVGTVVLLWGGQATPGQLWWGFIVTLVLFAVIQVLIGAGKAVVPDVADPDPTDPGTSDPGVPVTKKPVKKAAKKAPSAPKPKPETA